MEVLIVVIFGIFIWVYFGCRSYSMIKFICDNVASYNINWGESQHKSALMKRHHLIGGPVSYANSFKEYKKFMHGGRNV